MARKTAATRKTTKKTAAPVTEAAPVTTPAPTPAPAVVAVAKTEAAVATVSTTQAATNIPHALIAQRAYELFCARGYRHGFETQDWLQAERELRQAAARS